MPAPSTAALARDALAAPVRAAAPDSVAARVRPGVADSAAAGVRTIPPGPAPADTLPKARLSDQPRFVMLRSLVVPGWGQFHNHAWVKMTLVAGAEGWLISGLLGDQRALDRLHARALAAAADSDAVAEGIAVTDYNNRLNQFIGRQWLLGGVVVYALIDAYVDAHFRNFDVEFRTDPALPGGVPPAPETPRRGARAGSGRVSAALRWHF